MTSEGSDNEIRQSAHNQMESSSRSVPDKTVTTANMSSAQNTTVLTLKTIASSLPTGTSTVVTASGMSSADPLNFLTLQSQNGQVIIQQPLKSSGNGPSLVSSLSNGGLSKGHIVVRQKPSNLGTQQNSSSLLSDIATLEKPGMKRSLASSGGGNVITKVIITKNPVTGQPTPYPAGSSSQTLTLSLPNSSSLDSSGAAQVTSSAGQALSARTMTVTSQGGLSPVKTVIATIPGTGTTKISVPYHKIPISPAKTPTKITMIPVSRSPNKQLNPSNITVLSRTLNSLAQSGNMSLKPGSPSKVIIKQGPAPTGTSITLRAQTGPAITQTAPTVRAPQLTVQARTPQVATSVRPVALSTAGTVQPIQVPGSRFHYVRLVSPASQSNQTLATTVAVAKPSSSIAQVISAPRRTITPVTVTTASAPQTNQVKITLPLPQASSLPLAPKPSVISVTNANSQGSVHRIILPATTTPTTGQSNVVSNLAPIQPAPSPSIQPTVGQLPPGTAILSAGNNNLQGLQGFALVPASYVTQLQQQISKPQTVQANSQPAQRQRDYIPIASLDPLITQYTVSRNTPGPTLEATGARPRKPCNCTKSQCLKLYCDCFANGEFCLNCNCTNCANNLEHEEERSKAIKSCLERNPQAFHPKIGKSKDTEGNRRHNKGCNCKRSGCLKNYCECYEAKIMCSEFCKCVGCKNFEESPERKTLMHLADAAEVRVQQQTAAKTKLSSQISCVPSRPPNNTASGERLPFALITSDVAEATSACLLAQAEEAERMKMPPVVQERMVIEEFGRCLMQIIESANRTRTANTVA